MLVHQSQVQAHDPVAINQSWTINFIHLLIFKTRSTVEEMHVPHYKYPGCFNSLEPVEMIC